VGSGTITLLAELQAAVGSDKLIITKDQYAGGSERYVNAQMPMDTFCSCYTCDAVLWISKYAAICQTQILEAISLGRRGQVRSPFIAHHVYITKMFSKTSLYTRGCPVARK